MSDDTRDRVIRLEAEMSAMRRDFDFMNEKVTEMHSILLAAKGARWGIIGAASVGGFVLAKASSLLPWLSALPPK